MEKPRFKILFNQKAADGPFTGILFPVFFQVCNTEAIELKYSDAGTKFRQKFYPSIDTRELEQDLARQK